MSKAIVEKLLKEVLIKADSDFARKKLDSATQEVTLTKAALLQATKDTYRKVAAKTTGIPKDLTEKEYEKAAALGFDELLKALAPGGRQASKLTYSTNNIIKFSQPRAVKGPFNAFKAGALVGINQALKARRRRSLSTENGNNSETASFKAGFERLHGETTVGGAQLAIALKVIKEQPGFENFARTREYKSIKEKYGDVSMFFEVPNVANMQNFRVKENRVVGIRIESFKNNFAGSEHGDWANVRPDLEKSIAEFAERQNWYEMKGSPSLKDDHINAITANIGRALKGAASKSVKVRTNIDTKKVVRKKPKSVKTKTRASRKSKGSRAKAVSPGTPDNKQSLSTLAIYAYIQQRINQQVTDNMISPRLNYQTGRFAASVRVVDVLKTPSGFPSIGYTYQRNPYQVFEVGSRMGTVDRDPRALIEKSIREIAIDLAIGRFYTRRL